jgi:GNAT superfamily N-acetyltransferase
MHDIRIADTDDEIASTFAVMHQLRPHLAQQDYVALVRKQQQGGYLLAFVKEDEKVCAVAGFRLTDSLSWGHHAYVDDLISDENARSSGYGAALLGWIGEYAKDRGCKELHLDSGVQRHAAHRFYLRERMDITCYHFRLELQP